ncbi:MAG: GntR family transcriptional regulator [Dictyoglomaceae bacterium]
MKKDLPLPLYYKLRESIREKILKGDYPPGSKIPSEQELMQEYQVSRMTVIRAINDLVQEGLLYRKQGKGTFVSIPQVQQRLGRLTNFTQDMLARNLKPDSIILNLELISPSFLVQEKLKINEKVKIWKLERLRLADDTPMGIQVAYLPSDIFPIIDKEELGRGSLYEYLNKVYGITFKRAEETYWVRMPNNYEMEKLKIGKNVPVFYVQRLTFLADERPGEFVESVLRGDRYQLYVELTT